MKIIIEPLNETKFRVEVLDDMDNQVEFYDCINYNEMIQAINAARRDQAFNRQYDNNWFYSNN